MIDEYERAEQALAALCSDETAVSWPTVAERIRTARVRAGLTEAEVAERAGLPSASEYWDLERHDEEAFMSVSIAELHSIAAVLGTTGSRLLFGEDAAPPFAGPDCETIAHLLADRISSEKITAEELGDRLGWDLHDVLGDPEALTRLNIVGLRDVCKGVGVAWVGAFLAAGTRRPTMD